MSTQVFQIIEPVFSDPVSELPHSDLSASQNLNSISELDGDVTDVISDDDYDHQCSDGDEWWKWNHYDNLHSDKDDAQWWKRYQSKILFKILVNTVSTKKNQ